MGSDRNNNNNHNHRNGYFKRVWFDFRQGFATYLGFFLSGLNFIIIFYNFVVEKYPSINMIIPDFIVFTLVSCPLLFLLGWVFGSLHRRYQLSTDLELQAEKNPILMDMKRDIEEIKNRLT